MQGLKGYGCWGGLGVEDLLGGLGVFHTGGHRDVNCRGSYRG